MATLATACHRTLRATLTRAACLSLANPSPVPLCTACRARREAMKTRRPFDRSRPDRQPTAPRPWSRLPRRCRPAAPRSPSWARSWRSASPEAPSSCLTFSARRARRPVRLKAARQYQRMRRRLHSECLRSWQTLRVRGQGEEAWCHCSSFAARTSPTFCHPRCSSRCCGSRRSTTQGNTHDPPLNRPARSIVLAWRRPGPSILANKHRGCRFPRARRSGCCR